MDQPFLDAEREQWRLARLKGNMFSNALGFFNNQNLLQSRLGKIIEMTIQSLPRIAKSGIENRIFEIKRPSCRGTPPVAG